MKRTGPTNENMQKLIADLRSLASKEKVKIWKRIADDLAKPTRKRRMINLFKLNIYTKKGETVIVPGKVLATGNLNHNLTIAAWQFSDAAKEKINKNGKAISIEELMKSNPKGKKVRILG